MTLRPWARNVAARVLKLSPVRRAFRAKNAVQRVAAKAVVQAHSVPGRIRAMPRRRRLMLAAGMLGGAAYLNRKITEHRQQQGYQ